MYACPAIACPASWIAVARLSFGDVLDPDRGARLEGRDRLDEVVPAEPLAARVVGDRQRHRRDLLDHRRRVAVRDPRDLVAAARRVEVGLVRDLADVEVEDVEPVVLRRRAEPDVSAHPARADQRRVEAVDRDVRRADEVDLLLARASARGGAATSRRSRRGTMKLAVEQRVRPVREDTAEERRVVDAVHDDEQLVERQAAHPTAHAAGEHEAVEAHHRRSPGSRLSPIVGVSRCVEELLAPGARLEDQVARGVERAPRTEEEVLVRAHRRQRRDVDRAAEPCAERLAAHADGVDLVDEDDAGAAPLAGGALRLPAR